MSVKFIYFRNFVRIICVSVCVCCVFIVPALSIENSADSVPYAQYTPVEYIETTGSQYIDVDTGTQTGIFRIVATVFAENKSGYGKFLGYSSSTGGPPLGIWTYNDKIQSFFENSSGTNIAVTNKWQDIDVTKNSSSTIQNFYIFDVNPSVTAYALSVGKVKVVKLYKDSVLFCNFIPVRRKSDNTYGMYDTVNGKFYGNSGTGFFTGGAERTDLDRTPSEYTKLEYIQSSGTQYINTGVTFDNTTKTELIFEKLGNNVGETTGGRLQTQFGANDTTNKEILLSWGENGINYIKGTGFSNFIPALNTKYDIIVNYTKGATSLNINGTSYGTSTGTTGTSKNIVLFSILSSTASETIPTTFTKQKIYLTKIWNGATLVRNFIPAKRNSDNVLGMYDAVTNTFFTNSGTGKFIAGPAAIIKVATTSYVETAFADSVSELNTTIGTIKNVVDNTIIQADRIGKLATGKQNRPVENCPDGAQCLLITEADGSLHWYPICNADGTVGTQSSN